MFLFNIFRKYIKYEDYEELLIDYVDYDKVELLIEDKEEIEEIEITEIIEPKVKTGGITLYKIGSIEFKLESKNFNYFCFLTKNKISNIQKISNNIIKIELDRFAIRHV